MKVSEAHLPMACMIDGGTPFSARDVALLALNDWPAVSELKKCRNRLMKKDLVGITPLLVNHRGELKGNFLSRAWR